MADHPQKTGARARPMSPHLTIYRWQVTMLASITHRVTGAGLGLGALVLVWWLVAISNGPEGYENFMSYAGTPLGLLILLGFIWALAFHFLNGIRHLWQDLGIGYAVGTFVRAGWIVAIGSVVLTALVWACVLTRGGAA
jgi:succinate dehydrogenase / fumarate reductase cytochrome b subunit